MKKPVSEHARAQDVVVRHGFYGLANLLDPFRICRRSNHLLVPVLPICLQDESTEKASRTCVVV